MNIKPLRTEQDYQEALSLIEPFFDKEDELTQDEQYSIVLCGAFVPFRPLTNLK